MRASNNNNLNRHLIQKDKKLEYTIYHNKGIKSPLYIVNKKNKILLKCEKGEEINTNNYESIVRQKTNKSIQRYSVNRILNTEGKKENILIYKNFDNLSKKLKKKIKMIKL